MDKITILHLSDIHWGHDQLNPNIHNNVHPDIGRPARDNLARLKNKIKRLDSCPDFVVISGDITDQGIQENFPGFNDFFDGLIEAGKLPPKDRFIIVPGNHDVEETHPEPSSKALSVFFGHILPECVHPWNCNGPHKIDDMKQGINDFFNGGPQSKTPLPFLFDGDKHVVFYALNSCQYCRCTIGDSIRDIPRVADEEIELMEYFFSRMKEHNAVLSRNCLSVCVLHHHLTTFAAFEDLREFEIVSNAGTLKKSMADCGIDLLLHGHKHWPQPYHDISNASCRGFAAVSGGTILEETTNGQSPGFYLIDYQPGRFYFNVQYISLSNTPAVTKKLLMANASATFDQRVDIQQLYRSTEKALGKNLYTSEDKTGWDKILEEKKIFGVQGTAIALCVLRLTNANEPSFLENRQKIIDSLWGARKPDKGFGSSRQKSPSVEATCWVAKAFLDMMEWDKYRETIEDLCKVEDAYGCQGVFSVSFLLKTYIDAFLCLGSPECRKRIDALKRKLLESSILDGQCVYWGMDGKNSSIATTAHAVLALIKYCDCIKQDKKIDSLKPKVLNFFYQVKEVNDEGERILYTETYTHYSLSWFIQALIKLGVPKDDPLVKEKMLELLRHFSDGYWRHSSQTKIWEIYDSIKTIDEYIRQEFLI